MHCATDYLLPATYVNLSRKMADINLQIRIWEMCIPWCHHPKKSTPPSTYFPVIKAVFVAEETALTQTPHMSSQYVLITLMPIILLILQTTTLEILVCGFKQL
jgi:hypothetical protein